MINVNIYNGIHNVRIVITALLMLIFILTSASVLSATDPFTITEHTEYGLTENVVYVTVTENLDKDQSIDISHIFIDYELTDRLIYSDVLMNQSHQVNIYGIVNESIGKYKTAGIEYWDVDEIDIDTGDNITVTYNKTVYYDGAGINMDCDYVLDDKSCLIVVQDIIDTLVRHDYLPLPTLKEKIVVNGLKIELKESGIPLPKSSTIQLRYTVKHPVPFGSDYDIIDTDYNKYNITVCSSSDPGECTTLDPEWYNESWLYRRSIITNMTENMTDFQVLLNLTDTMNMQGDCSDIRPVDKDNNTMEYWIETCAVNATLLWVKGNFSTYNETWHVYYGNTTNITGTDNLTAAFWWADTTETGVIETLWTNLTNEGGTIGYNANHPKQGTKNLDVNITGGSGDYTWAYKNVSDTVGDSKINATYTYNWYDNNVASENNVIELCGTIRAADGATQTIIRFGNQDAVNSTHYIYLDMDVVAWVNINIPQTTGFHKMEIKVFNSNYTLFMDEIYVGTFIFTTYEPKFIYFGGGGGGIVNSKGYYDDIRIRKYLYPEPTISIGTEETAVTPEFIVHLNSPTDTATTTDKTPDFNFTVNGTEDTYSCELFLNDTGYGLNATTLNNTATVITTNASLVIGTYDWYVNCSADGVENSSDIWTLEIEPYFDITLNAPGDDYNTSDSTPDFNFTVDGSENTYSCELFLNGTGYGVIEDSWCYQETTNESTACGGLDTGTYDFTDVNWTNPENVYDGDWNTYGYVSSVGCTYGYINYTKPVGATNDSLWQIKRGLEAVINLSIVTVCWNQDILQFNIQSCDYGTGGADKAVFVYCWNGTNWKYFNGLQSGPGAEYVYEEAMYWDIEIDNNTATVITANATVADGTYDWYINCTAGSTVNQSSTYSITVDTVKPQIDFVSPTDSDNTNTTKNYTYLNWTVTELHQDKMILNWNGSNSTVTNTFINKTSLSEGTYTYYVWANDTAGNSNQSETHTFTIDITAPVISAYYQWDSANVTVDFDVWTEGFVSINWNLTDATGINASSCWIRVRNKDYATNYTNMSYIDDLAHPDYDTVTGYKNLTCYTEDLGGGVTRVSANMTRSYDWRPLNTAFDQDIAAHDNTYHSHGGRSTKIIFHNITNTINTTFIFLADIDNQASTVADHLFYSCNLSYVDGDYTTSDFCSLVGAVTTNATRDVNFGYVIGALMTDENGTFGGVVHTETMYGISYCPSCTNNNNAWLTYSTSGQDGHSATSPNMGTTWTNLTGEEFNVILHVIDNTRLEFNLTIDDPLDNQLSDLQTDDYGILGNLAPFGDITTDNITGSLVSYYDIHGITESGTICINVTVSDPNADTMNVSIYLLNNDSTMNQTLLLNQSIDAYGIICYQWDTTNVSNGDYRLNVTADDGSLIGYDESAGYIRIDNGIITIVLNNPVDNAVTNDNTPSFNFTVTGNNASYSCNMTINGTSYNFSDVYQEDPSSYTYDDYYFYANYTILDYYSSTDSIWTVKHGAVTDNYTLALCSNSSPLQFRLFSNYSNYYDLYNYSAECWNGSVWYVLDSDNGTTCGPAGGGRSGAPSYLYDGDWNTASFYSLVRWYNSPSGDIAVSTLFEEAMTWTVKIYNDTASIVQIDNILNDSTYSWNITCGYDTFTNTSATHTLTVDSISESVSTDFSNYNTPNTAWGFPDGITDEADTDLMLKLDINFSQLSPDASNTPYSLNITTAYITNTSNYAVYQVLNSTDDNITYTVIGDILNFTTEDISVYAVYKIFINITQGVHLETKIQSSGYDTPWTYASVQLDDSITLNVSGSIWVHQALGASSYFDANTQALYVYYDCGDAVMVTGDLFSLGYTPAGYLITKENELDNSFNSIASCSGHPYSVAINMRAYDSASDNTMDKLTYNASFPNHNTTLAKQEFSMAIIADSGIDRPYIESSSSTYEPADTPKSGSGLDSPEDIIEEIKKKFIEERLLLCPTGYFFNHTSNRCEPYISPLAVLEQDIINCTRELFGLITRPVVISVPVYIQEHTMLGPQLVIPSIFFILLFVAALYIYYSKIPPKDIVSRLRKAFKTPKVLRPSPAAITPVVGRHKVLRPAR